MLLPKESEVKLEITLGKHFGPCFSKVAIITFKTENDKKI